jgi:hypothetical protein
MRKYKLFYYEYMAGGVLEGCGYVNCCNYLNFDRRRKKEGVKSRQYRGADNF